MKALVELNEEVNEKMVTKACSHILSDSPTIILEVYTNK